MPLQKPNLKKVIPPNSMQKTQAWGEKLLRQLFGATVSFKKARDILQNNYELGLQHLMRGNLSDAILRFKLVTWLDPTYAQAWYHLGRAYLSDGKSMQAVAALRKSLKLMPAHEEASYLLALALGDQASAKELPRKIPMSLALAHFEAQAADFTREQLETYRYQGHTLLVSGLREYLIPGRIDHAILELGVGTGLVGPGLRDIAAQIVGVDFSGRMLEQAMQVKDSQGKKVYDALIKRDLHEFLQDTAAATYDMVLAATTFSYIGDLQGVFQQVTKILKPGGLFAFTVDKQQEPEFRFDPKLGRFRYSQLYLRTQATHVGLAELKCEEAPVYPQNPMWLCVFRKP